MGSASDSSSQLLSAMDSRLPEGSPSLLMPAGRARLSSAEFFLRRLFTVSRLPDSLKPSILWDSECKSPAQKVCGRWLSIMGWKQGGSLIAMSCRE